MAVSVKRGEGSERMSRLGMLLGGCILVAGAGPLVEFFFRDEGTRGRRRAERGEPRPAPHHTRRSRRRRPPRKTAANGSVGSAAPSLR